MVVHFGNGDLAAYDFAGQKIWHRNLQDDYGNYTIWWGHANSPVLHGICDLHLHAGFVSRYPKRTRTQLRRGAQQAVRKACMENDAAHDRIDGRTL